MFSVFCLECVFFSVELFLNGVYIVIGIYELGFGYYIEDGEIYFEFEDID